MTSRSQLAFSLSLALALLVCACKHKPSAGPTPPPPAPDAEVTTTEPAVDAAEEAPPPPRIHDALGRADFNRFAVRLNLPVYWIADDDSNHAIDPGEVAALRFYPSTARWVSGGHFTAAFESAYDQIVAASQAVAATPSTDEQKRIAAVDKELDQGRAALVLTDFTGLGPSDRDFVGHMLNVASLIDQLYLHQNGAAALADQVGADPDSQSLFRRNRGARCLAPATEKDPVCSAVPGAPKTIVDVYPPEIQSSTTFCADLEKDKDAAALLGPFTVVRGKPDQMTAVPYTVAYATEMKAIATELRAAAASIKDPDEGPLVTYLRAAADSFGSNDWLPSDEAWAKMTVDNSKWYVRVAADEVYWEPCAHKAGFHLTFARINQGSRAWQEKLVPVQQDMEAAIAERAGAPYQARTVTFHLPDFIDIIVNAGDDRAPFGATIGQSLPNWGPVANEGRGRTVAMSNLYTDPDSMAARRAQASSLLDQASMASFVDQAGPGLLGTILHEATHNLGPSHEYQTHGLTDDAAFGGPLASVLEELKAQTGALFLLEFLRKRGIVSDDLAAQTYLDNIVWAFGHISQGMYTATGERKAYSQLAAVQIGFLIDHKALVWDKKAKAANGTDKGAFVLHLDRMPAVAADMMKVVAGIKARGDKKAAMALITRYVDGKVVPQAVIAARFLRFPKASFVYAVAL